MRDNKFLPMEVLAIVCGFANIYFETVTLVDMMEHDVFRISESGELKGPSTSTVRLRDSSYSCQFLMYFKYPLMVHKSLSMKVLVCGFD